MKQTKKNNGRHARNRIDKETLTEIQTLLGESPRDRDLLIEFLHRIQDRFHHISSRHILALSKEMKLSTAEIYEVATFYHHFDVIKDDETPPPSLTVRICDSITCEMFGSEKLIAGMKQIEKQGVRIQRVPCVGRCHVAPVAVVGQNALERAVPETVHQAIDEKQISAKPPAYINYVQYRETGGYETYLNCLNDTIKAEDIIEIIKESNLRGLGGAGFPTFRKWEILRQQKKPRLVAINIDEGEPGTFKDRFYLEQDPHRFLEGTLIAHQVIDADGIYIYLRDEYAGCREILGKEIESLKNDLADSLPEIHLRRGAGAYICGEESAMIESIEGKRGMPRLRPPYIAEIGLFGRPTLEQNMETMHWIRDIIEKGAGWFNSHGRHGRNGLRSFSVSGRVKKPGVHLASAGITIRELIDEYCGGMQDGHKFYAYFPGGASGGILPASLDNIPLDFDTLQEYGCFIGSAAIIVLSDKDSVRNSALNAMKFFEHESCGQCTPCRVGTAKTVKLMKQKNWDKKLLEELAGCMEDASICGLGQAAPNPLRCAIKYFPEEFK